MGKYKQKITAHLGGWGWGGRIMNWSYGDEVEELSKLEFPNYDGSASIFFLLLGFSPVFSNVSEDRVVGFIFILKKM